MTLYGYEVNTCNYKCFKTEQLKNFRSMLKSNIKNFENVIEPTIEEMINENRNELEVGNETAVMMYLNILKYAKHHCPEDEDPYEIADRIFTDMLAANKASN